MASDFNVENWSPAYPLLKMDTFDVFLQRMRKFSTTRGSQLLTNFQLKMTGAGSFSMGAYL